MNDAYDVVICGAGTAGLSTAVFCARNGQQVLVIEKQSGTGSFPRGETLRPDSIIEDLLGQGFMDLISLNQTAKRRYWCPGSNRSFSLERENASHIFHWKDLTEGLREVAEKAGVELIFNSEVVSPIVKRDCCIGINLKDGRRFFGKTIVAADGHNSILGKFCGINYSSLNCPIAKRVYHNLESDYDGMEYFFITTGMLNHAPDFPPAIAFIFPRGNGQAEVGLLLLMGALPRTSRAIPPDRNTILGVLQDLSESYPVFSERLRHGKVAFEGVSIIPMGGFHPVISTVPGLILTGDTVGLVEASGGCGIVATMKHGAFVADFLKANPLDQWDRKLMMKLNKTFRRSAIYKHIRKKYQRILPVMKFFFHKKRPVFLFERLWTLLGIVFKKV